MKEYKPIEYRHPLRIVLSILLVCVLILTIAVSGVLSPTALASDMIIELGPENGQVSAKQLRATEYTGPFDIKDQYETLWGTETQVEIFKVSYENDRQEITVAGKNNEKVIAPGTENSYTFVLKNNGDGWLDYTVVVEAFFAGLDGSDKIIPIQARLKGQEWLAGSETEYRPVLELNQVNESGVLRKRNFASYTLQWQWPFEQDLNGDGDISDGDALDTWLASQTEDISLSIRITVLSSYHYPAVPPVLDPVPPSLNGDTHTAYLYGYPDGTVRPEDNITRAEVAAIFYRLLTNEVREEFVTDVCRYPDVTEDKWYFTEVATLTNMSILKGYPDGQFHGDDPITRAELATILARFSEEEISAKGKTAFSDIEGHWAEGEIKTIEDFNWIEGYPDGTFCPDNNITRAETATMVNRMLHRLPEKISDLLPGMRVWPDNMNEEAWYYLAIQEATNSHDYQRLLGTREKWTNILDVVQISED